MDYQFDHHYFATKIHASLIFAPEEQPVCRNRMVRGTGSRGATYYFELIPPIESAEIAANQ